MKVNFFNTQFIIFHKKKKKRSKNLFSLEDILT